jgi:hypothetical protein
VSTDKLSSSWTFFRKRISPILVLGILIAVVAAALSAPGDDPPAELLFAPVLFGVVWAAVFRKLMWTLADEVALTADVLIVRKGDQEERVRLTDIMNVGTRHISNFVRVELRLRTPGKFGDEIVFIPRAGFQLNPFARNEMAEKLILLVDRARQRDQSR